jgi:hypothetical protein
MFTIKKVYDAHTSDGIPFIQSVETFQANHETMESAVKEFRNISRDYPLAEIRVSTNNLLIVRFFASSGQPEVVTFWIESN